MRVRDEHAFVPLQAGCVLRSRQRCADENCRKERDPEGEAALPSTTHGGDPTNRRWSRPSSQRGMFRPRYGRESAETADFVRSMYLPGKGRLWLGKRLQPSESAARVPNLCGPAPSGTVPVDPVPSW